MDSSIFIQTPRPTPPLCGLHLPKHTLAPSNTPHHKLVKMSWRPRARTTAEIMSYLEKETEEETESSSESSDNSSDESCEEVLITKATVFKAIHQIAKSAR